MSIAAAVRKKKERDKKEREGERERASAKLDSSHAVETQKSHLSEREDVVPKLPPWRRRIAVMLNSRMVDVSINILISMNLVLVVAETDSQSLGDETPDWITTTNYLMLLIFLVELVLRLFAYRLFFFRQAWNIMDFGVVSLDMIGLIVQLVGGDLPSMSVLRIFRLARLCRGVKVIRRFPKLALLVQGCFAAASPIMWGMALVGLIVLLWSILAVNIIHPLATQVSNAGGFDGCARCPNAYETVGASMLTLLQANIAGDSWGLTTIPIIEAFPFSGLFFGSCFMTVQVALLNVILATIVESAMEASENNTKLVLDAKERAKREASHDLVRMCEEIDTDGDGSITIEEFKVGVDSHPELRELLQSMDISSADYDIVFQILDVDKSGIIEYREFVDELHKMKAHDSHTMLVFIHYYITQIRDSVSEQLQLVKIDILGQLRSLGRPTQDKSERIHETKFSLMKMDAEWAQSEAPIQSGTQDDGGSSEMKCQKVRRLAVDDFELVSEQLGSLRDDIQKDLVQRLVEIPVKFDSILDVGPANESNPHQSEYDPSGAGSNAWGARSSAWRGRLQRGAQLREAENTGAANGERSFILFGCEVAERALSQTLSLQRVDTKD